MGTNRYSIGIRQVVAAGIGWGPANVAGAVRDYYESYDGEQVLECEPQFGTFFGVGANISVGFNISQLHDDLNSIWGY